MSSASPADAALQEALAARTLALCAVKSPLGEEAGLCDLLAAELSPAWPGELQRIGNSLVLGRVRTAETGRPALLLLGHLDTVPLQPGDFPARREAVPSAGSGAARIFGRGASDMKGGVAVLCELFARLGARGRAALRVDPVVVLYDKEEGPFEQSGLIAVLAARPDLRAASLAICLEPTDLAVQVGCCGSLHATFTFSGRAAHSARPWQGENAVHRAGPLLAHLAERGRREVVFRAVPESPPGGAPAAAAPLELAFYEVLSCTRIDGFTGRNVVPAGCALNLNFRFAPGRSVAEAEAELTALAERFGARCEVTDRAPSGPVALGQPLLQRLVQLAGGRIEPKQAWTDVARLGAAGVPAVNFGPGEQAQAHQPGESCLEAPLRAAYGILLRLLEEGA